MKLHMHLPVIVLSFLALLLCGSVRAQETTGIRVHALTSAERDSITLQLEGNEVQLVYACVPAGMLVFATDVAGTSRATLRSKAITALSDLITSNRIAPVELTRVDAESACQSARGQ